MKTFYVIEVIQFFVGLFLVMIAYLLINHYRKAVLDNAFGGDVKTEKSFVAMTDILYFLVFIPILFFGINIAPPADYNIGKHIQYTIYFEAGLVLLIGVLHFLFMTVSTKIKVLR
jgi:hypothetical protein